MSKLLVFEMLGILLVLECFGGLLFEEISQWVELLRLLGWF
jgi:hypothetical protein